MSPTRNSRAPETLHDFDAEETYRVTEVSSALEVGYTE
ncbi:hypothetical protein J2S48_004207 [Promicromonospora iranensis]|uniref:Coenzyme PQQ synthesis protein A n=1 Tax=Promicromonospora iranensis TaxID=1105144 RepID=A0ABU2CU66_9MICO|nr:hypothetical protein [Promicromonospora iranensis]